MLTFFQIQTIGYMCGEFGEILCPACISTGEHDEHTIGSHSELSRYDGQGIQSERVWEKEMDEGKESDWERLLCDNCQGILLDAEGR